MALVPLIAALFTLNFKLLTVFAQSPKNTITVLPQLTQIDLAKDAPETKIYYTNNSSTPVELSFSVEDVRELEDRNPVGILDPKEAANYKYSLSSWVYLDKQTLLLAPHETQNIIVNITKDKLTPGGHYGSILAEIKQTSNDKKIRIKGVLASLLFVRASTGNEIEEARIAYFGAANTGIDFPDQFVFRFQNTGNVDLTPYGLVEIKDNLSRTVAKGIVNEDSLITLPEAIRKYELNIKPLSTIILPGRYKAVLSIHYGKSGKKLAISKEFITQGSINLLNIGIGLLLSLFAFFFIVKLLRSTINSKP